MSNSALDWAWTLKIKPTQKLVLLRLADMADVHGVCWPSISRIARDTGFDPRTVGTALKELCALEVMARRETPGKGYRYTLFVPGASRVPGSPGVPGSSGVPGTTDSPPPPAPDAGHPPQTAQGHPIIEPLPNHQGTGKRIGKRTGQGTGQESANPARARTGQRPVVPPKLLFGQFRNVKLTQAEHDALFAKFPDKAAEGIEILSAQLAAKGDTYKSHYATFFTWVLKAVDEHRARARASFGNGGGSGAGNGGGYPSPGQRRLQGNMAAMEAFINDSSIGAAQ
ncbi:MAG: hypothetical protein DELT_01711 [Desulfovibrio sp.]